MSEARKYRHEPAFMVICSDGDYVLESKYAELKAENEALRKGWYLNECGDNKFWPEEMEELKAESEELRKAITDIYDALYREYWSEYAGLDETRAILDASLCLGEKS